MQELQFYAVQKILVLDKVGLEAKVLKVNLSKSLRPATAGFEFDIIRITSA